MKIPYAFFVCFAAVDSFFSGCYATENRMPPENAIPLYTHNFTRINDYCTGNFTLAEHIDGSRLNNSHFPICSILLNNASLTHGGGYRIQNLDISKPGGTAAMIGTVNNTYIDLILESPRVEGNRAAVVHHVLSNNRIKAIFYKGGYFKGESWASILAFQISFDNNHIVQIAGDNEALIVEAGIEVGGSVNQIIGNRNYFEQQGGSTYVRATASTSSFAGGHSRRIQGSSNTVLQNGCELTVTGQAHAGGVTTSIVRTGNRLIQRGCHIKVNGASAAGAVLEINGNFQIICKQIQCQIEVTGKHTAIGGFGLSGANFNQNTLFQADNRITVNATQSDGRATGGLALTYPESDTTLIQINNQMSITGTTATSAFLTTVTGSQDLRLLLYSGNLMDNQATTVCPDSTSISGNSLIDIAGYTIDAESCSSQVARLNSTEPDDWHRLQQSFCEYATCAEDTSCHYPNEQLQALVPAGNGTLWLVTRQRYPSNPELNRISPVRISRFLVSDTGTRNSIIPDNGLSLENTRVLTPSSFNNEPLPDTSPIARIVGQNRLILLYSIPESGEILLASFPLNEGSGDYYDTHAIIGLSGQPVLLSNDQEEDTSYLWMREQDDVSDTLRRYALNGTNPIPVPDTEYNLATTDYPDAPVVGLGFDSQWFYIARYQDSSVVVERVDRITAQLDNWSAESGDIPELVSSTGLPYQLHSAGNQLYLVPVHEGVLQPEDSTTPKALNVEWPGFGGCAQWTCYLPLLVMPKKPITSASPVASSPVLSSPVPSNPAPTPDNPDHGGLIIGSMLGAGVVIAGAVVSGIILIKLKSHYQKK